MRINPAVSTQTMAAGQAVTLETDITTPLAYTVSHAPKAKPVAGLFDVETMADRAGL